MSRRNIVSLIISTGIIAGAIICLIALSVTNNLIFLILIGILLITGSTLRSVLWRKESYFIRD